VRIVRGIRQKHSPARALLRRWPFLLACAFLGLVLTGIVLLARPPLYEARATVRFDPQRYAFAVQGEGGQWTLPPALPEEARSLLALDDLHTGRDTEPPAEFGVADEGTLFVLGQSSDPRQATASADRGAAALADALQTIHGGDLLRALLRRAIYQQGRDQPEPASLLTPHLFALLDAGFLAYDPAIPVSESPLVLTVQDVDDMTRAVQRMEDRQRAEVDALFEERAQTQDPAKLAVNQQKLVAATAGLERLRAALIVLNKQGGTLYQGGSAKSPPEVLPAGEPTAPPGPAQWPFLFVGAGGGLLLGLLLALADEFQELSVRLREVVAYRDLIWNLVLRDLKARYKNSILGYLWSLVNPLLLMAVFTVLFKYLLRSAIPNFPVFIIVGLLAWNFCASSVSGAVGSITGQGALVKKVYFPREAVPIALVIANLVNYLLALPAMFLIMLLLNAHLQPVALLFPLIALIETIFLLGLALFLSCLNVFFRDTQVIMEVLLTAWFFLTPVFYRLNDIVDERLGRLVRWLNPMASLIDFYRDIFYLGGMPGWDAIIRTLITALLVLVVGYLFFVRFSARFGEEI
jgi:lipopolysaccharide transport system permease protein